MHEEKLVYEEWRTYPPVPENKKQDKVLPESDKNSDIVDNNLHNGKNKSKTL